MSFRSFLIGTYLVGASLAVCQTGAAATPSPSLALTADAGEQTPAARAPNHACSTPAPVSTSMALLRASLDLVLTPYVFVWSSTFAGEGFALVAKPIADRLGYDVDHSPLKFAVWMAAGSLATYKYLSWGPWSWLRKFQPAPCPSDANR